MNPTILFRFLAGVVLAGTCFAQNPSRFAFNVGGGFTEPVGGTDGRVNTGFNLNAGAGVNFVPHFGLVAEFGFNHFGLSSATLAANGVPDGSARMYSATLNPIFHANPRGRFDAYLIGGGGYYRRTVEFTAPTVTTVTGFDPFYGVFFPLAVPADVVLGSFTQNKIGWNVGGGVSVRVRGDSNAKLYAESRYTYVYTSPVRTMVLPVTFGLRW